MSTAYGNDGMRSFAEAVTHARDGWATNGEWEALDLSLAGLTEAAQGVSNAAVLDVCVLAHGFVVDRASSNSHSAADCRAALEEWSSNLLEYLRSSDEPSARAVVESLDALGADQALDDDDRTLLTQMLVIINDDVTSTMPLAVPATGAAPAIDSGAATSVPEPIEEMRELLIAELEQISELVAEAQPGLTGSVTADDRVETLDHIGEQIERFASAAEAVGFDALANACTLTRTRLSAMAHEVLSHEAVSVLAQWAPMLKRYLNRFDDAEVHREFIEYHCHPTWPTELDDTARARMQTGLGRPSFEGVQEAVAEPRQTVATADDVSLTLPDDVDPQLLEGLLQELPTQTTELSAAVERLTSGGSAEDLDVAQRVAHTLKGAANTVGVPGIANLTHHLEDMLSLAKRQATPSILLLDTLMRASDCLEGMSEALMDMGTPPADSQSILQSVLDLTNRIEHGELADLAVATGPLPTVVASAPEPPATPSKVAATEHTVRVPAALLDDMLRLVGETIILTGQLRERVERTRRQTRTMRSQFAMLQSLGHELEELVDLRDMTLPRERAADPDFDPLELDQYNELHTVARRLVEAATDSREMGTGLEDGLALLDDMLIEQGRLNRDSQNAVLQTRMVKVKTIVPRLQRSVRQTCRLTGKSAELTVTGEDTLMDSDVLNDLVDPLMHVIRNAVDHGIETSVERIEGGKDPCGHITLTFNRDGNSIAVRCADDGHGIDLQRVRATAENRGILSPDAPAMDDELLRMVLLANFSTRDEATQTSGRGIGLDAVNQKMTELGGSLALESETQRGCTVVLRLPVTLISTHALIVRAREQVFAISNRGISQILHSGVGDEQNIGNEITLRDGESVHGTTTLESLLNIPGDRRQRKRAGRPALLVEDHSGITAVFVQEVIDSRDVVVKNLGRYLPQVRGVSGATILGDGSVAAVIDLPELVRDPLAHAMPTADTATPIVVTDSHLPTAFVVDDSLSARRALARFMQDIGYEVRMARDGLEAIELLNAKTPDLLLVDLEMPRMNGLELCGHVRSRADTKHLPVIMITSRSTEKHRQQAQAAGVDVYLTKPFSEDELMEHVLAIQKQVAA